MVIFVRLIQSSITNATILKNLVSQDIKIGTKDTALAIAESYLAKATSDLKNHRHEKVTEVKKNCVNNKSCGKRTVKKMHII